MQQRQYFLLLRGRTELSEADIRRIAGEVSDYTKNMTSTWAMMTRMNIPSG